MDRCIRTLIENSGSFPELQDELQESYDSYIQDPPIPNDFRCQTPVAYVLSVCSSDLTPVNIGRIVKGSRGLFVSSTELLKCHAYTKCTVAILLPKGIKLELVCTPSRHIEILAKIPVASSPRQSQSIVTQPTALGVNDTNVAELSQALQSSLSLDTNTGLPQPNASVESPPKVSSEVHADEHKKGILLKPKFLPLFQVVRDLLPTPHSCAMNFIVKRLSPPLLHGLLNKIPNLKELVVQQKNLLASLSRERLTRRMTFPKKYSWNRKAFLHLLERMKILGGEMMVRNRHWRWSLKFLKTTRRP